MLVGHSQNHLAVAGGCAAVPSALIDQVYPLDQAAEAQRRVVEDRPFGRVFLDPQT